MTERSVAVEASGRMGNVASDIIDPPDVCRGCGMMVWVANAIVGRLALAVDDYIILSYSDIPCFVTYLDIGSRSSSLPDRNRTYTVH